MIFVTAHRNRSRLEQLTKLLVCAFPGSVIDQHTDLLRAPHDAWNNKTDAVFLEAEADSAMTVLKLLRRRDPALPVFLLSESERLRAAAMEAGAAGYLVQPVCRQDLNTLKKL